MDQRTKIVVSALATAAVVGGAVAFALSGRQAPEPQPTPTVPGIGEPTVTSPVDPNATPTPSTDPPADEQEPTTERDLINSGDGDAEGYLPESVWREDLDDSHDHDAHGDVEDTTTQWLPVVEAFAAAIANTERPHEQWHADIAQYLSPRLADLYADPGTQESLSATTPEQVSVVYGGETSGRALIRFANHHMDMYVSVGPADSPSGWEVKTIESP